jgi:transposase
LDATGVQEGVSVSNRSRRYSPEFRAEAVRLYRSIKGEKSMRELAVELGISNETLRSWIKQADADDGRTEGLTTEERDELGKLRRKVRILEEEREILKKAAAFFAKETGSTSK